MRAFAVLTIALSLAACGGGSKKSTPDASTTHDSAMIDSPVQIDAPANLCGTTTTATPGTLDILGANTGTAAWGGPITGMLGGSAQTFDYQIQFYSGIETSLMGTFDLSAGNQANFKTCAICVLAFSSDRDADGNPTTAYFQKSGSITLTEDPFTNSHLIASISNLELQEVTIDWANDYTSTPVASGTCANLADQTIDHDKVPNAFTCTHDKYTDGTTCDCDCGLQDPDCFVGSNAIAGCTGAQLCYNSTCQTAPANDTCAAATTLTLGTAVTGTTVGAPNDYNLGLEGATCDAAAQPGSDVVYKVTLAPNTAYTVALTGLDPTFDGSVALVGPGTAAAVCGATITTCVAGADAGFEGDSETFNYTTPATAGTYYVIVDSFYAPGREAGAFTLTVSAM